MVLYDLRSREGIKAFYYYASTRLKIDRLSTYTKSRSSYDILNSLISEAYYLYEL
jgi:hypothetical protein